MRYKMKVTGRYSTKMATDKDNARDLALHHFYVSLMRWADGRDLPARMFDIEITEVKDNK